MRISYLELKNYRRFRELKLQFPDGIVGILGLNGVGKTTIIEALAWALFGNVEEVVRTSREGVRRSGAGTNDSCVATVEFELGGSEYRIVREMGGKSLTMRAELRTKEKVLAEGDKPVRKMVERLIGMDHKSFFTSVFARQKELNALQNVAAGERKKVVLRMLRIDGVDDFLADVRSDRKDALSRIEGAQKTLLTEDGREKEMVLAEKIPELERVHEKATKDLGEAEAREDLAAKEAERVRAQRDTLKKDVDAYNASLGEFKVKQSTIKELRERQSTIEKRVADAEVRLKRLPDLERQEKEWAVTSDRKDALEKEKAKHDRAESIRTEIVADEKNEGELKKDLIEFEMSHASGVDVSHELELVDKSKVECEDSRANIARNIGEFKAKAAERKAAAEKDRKKLKEIREAGKEGTCPTCERKLDEAYELLLSKLMESSETAEKEAKEELSAIAKLEGELQGVVRKEEALKKKRLTLEQKAVKRKQIEASIEAKQKELAKVTIRIDQRRKALSDVGAISFTEEEHARVKRDFERLRQSHEEYLKLRSIREQMDNYARDLLSVKDSIKRNSVEEETLAGMVRVLEPKKALFDSKLKELDEKTVLLNLAKDNARKLSTTMERAHSELDRAHHEIEQIRRQKKAIEEDRKKADDLSLLEETVANFKDHLIGRIAPALSELTSRSLESMTEGKYTGVELDEDYEMQIDDQGTSYPISRFSGGEADLANLSLRLAISRIIADRTGAAPINFLILDEIFGSQDPNRKRSVLSALAGLSSQFRQIFLITHIEDVKDSMNYVIRVEEQEDGTSKASLVG